MKRDASEVQRVGHEPGKGAKYDVGVNDDCHVAQPRSNDPGALTDEQTDGRRWAAADRAQIDDLDERRPLKSELAQAVEHQAHAREGDVRDLRHRRRRLEHALAIATRLCSLAAISAERGAIEVRMKRIKSGADAVAN